MKLEFSAGGVVLRGAQDKIEVLVCQHAQHHGWVFPKGLIGDQIEGEHKEQTALREVEEETGVIATIQKVLKPVTYWYQFKGEKRKKTVYYFLMEYKSGNIAHHDHEMEKVEWLPIDKVDERLTYPSDKKVWQQAKKLITNQLLTIN